jgi:N-acetylglucosaminyldiphosphoundecaprenol N-acetyl-beta-D-mannosaminyltransferase
MKSQQMWGIRFDILTQEAIKKKYSNYEMLEYPHQIIGVNPETIVKAKNYPELFSAIDEAETVLIDNTLVYLMLKLFGRKPIERNPSPDVMELLLQVCNENKLKIFLLGAREEIVKLAAENIKRKFPDISDIYFRNGYFSNEEEIEIFNQIKELRPNFLFIGLPTPQKEILANKYKNYLNATVLFGIGGAIDVYSGKVKRAGKFFRKLGLEGFFRLFQDPTNYGKRQLQYYPEFFKFTFSQHR